MKVAVIDYEVGNLANVYNAWKRLGVAVDITRDPAVIRQADFIELPGVGAIRDAMANLKKFELIPVLEEQVRAGKFSWAYAWACRRCLKRITKAANTTASAFCPATSCHSARR